MTDRETPGWVPFRSVETKLDRLASNEPTEPLTGIEAQAIVERIARARDYFDRTNKDWEDPRWRGAKLFYQLWNTIWLTILFTALIRESGAVPVLSMTVLILFSLMRLWEDIVDNKESLANLVRRFGTRFDGLEATIRKLERP